MPVTPRQLYVSMIVGELHGQLTVTRFWIRGGDSSPASTIAAEIAGIRLAMFNTILPAYKNFLTSAWHGNHMLTMNLTTNPKVMIDEVIAVSGDQDATALPSFCAGLLSLRTGFAGRTRSGRLYLPGIASGDSDASLLTGGAFGLLQTFGNTLISTFGPSGSSTYGRLGVFSRKLGVTRVVGPPPSLTYSTAGWTQITQAIARPEVASMRKRKLGRGQ